MDKKDIRIPTLPPRYERTKIEYPITPRENLLKVLNHEKPMWMPDLYGSSQMGYLPYNGDMPYNMFGESEDWFGCYYGFSPIYGTCTPRGQIFECVDEWKEKLIFPDLDKIDWVLPEGYERDENLALYTSYGNGMWERLHICEGFECALIDLLEEPEACKDYFAAMCDYKMELFDKMNDLFGGFDYIVYNDDWGTAKGPFFSLQVFEDIILEPTIRYVKHVQDTGTKLVFHNCGKIEKFIPYLVEDIKVDGLEIQQINDTKSILDKYGDRVFIEYHPDPYQCYDYDTTEEEIKATARGIVDNFGATAVPGSGVVVSMAACTDKIYNAFHDEIYNYSLELYK